MADTQPIWRTSTRSGNGGNCVEVAANLVAATGAVLVRDSKDPSGPVLTVPATGWTSFLTAVHAGRFDR